MKVEEWTRKAGQTFQQYKYVLLVVLAGVVLLLWPGDGTDGGDLVQTGQAQGETGLFQTAALEEKLERALSRIEGAGDVSVVLTLSEGPRRVLAQDGRASEESGRTSREVTTVVTARGSGVQEPVIVQEMAPRCQGALVVASGAADPRVKLDLCQAVAALTGLGTDRISVCVGK